MTIQQARRQAPTSYASAYAPAGRRSWWHYAYRCACCGVHQFGRAPRLEDVTGPRRAGCGHKITVVIARIYGRPGAA